MRWSFLTALALILVSPMASMANPSAKGVISCTNSSLDSLPSNWSIPDQSCIRVDLGELQPEETLFFEVDADQDVDVLLFPASTVSVYQSEQTYRIDSVWQRDSVFESFSGSGEWHWTVPSDREATRWYLVLDNIAHPSDSGQGSQGGQVVEASLDAGIISPQVFTLADSIHRVDAGSYSSAAGPFSVDEGTFLEIYARTMQGSPDIFVMTETAYSLYSPSENWSSSSRIVSADMLLVTNERYLPWEVIGTEGENLYVVVDNRAGPGGGGAGTSHAAVTVTVTLTPVLDPIITSETDLESVDVGTPVFLSALGTPNNSNQIPESGFSWDIDDDGVSDALGTSVTHSWDSPGNYPVRLSVTSIDSRSASSTREILVVDKSDPVVSMSSSESIVKGFGESLEISGTFSDNWGIERIDWMIDGNVLESNYSVDGDSSSISIEVSNNYSPGTHIVSLVVTDKSGRSTQGDTAVSFVDITPPEILPYNSEMEVTAGDPVIFQISAVDNQSSEISYTWIIGQGTEEEIQFNGPQVLHEFSSEGPQNVYCRVENEAGLSSYAEFLVVVQSDGGGSGLGTLSMVIISIFAAGMLAVGGFVAFNLAVKRRMSDMAKEEEGEEAEEKEEITQTPQSQIGMWENRENSPFQPAYQSEVQNEVEIDISDLIDVTPDLETKMDPLEGELPSEITDTEVEEKVEKTEADSSRSLRKDCSSCSKAFELEMPEGIDTAYTNCPHCGSEELVSL
ncbi:MAG: PKD domain-containing protein [Candidatus Thermoplasmatota archaeon]|nr:PKD domain-containing protein [Candidatus Thermoplasmatota archaeon]